MFTLTRSCPICAQENEYSMDVEPSQVHAWQDGLLIQEAMPELSPDEREVFITGMCYDCQSSVFQ